MRLLLFVGSCHHLQKTTIEEEMFISMYLITMSTLRIVLTKKTFLHLPSAFMLRMQRSCIISLTLDRTLGKRCILDQDTVTEMWPK